MYKIWLDIIKIKIKMFDCEYPNIKIEIDIKC